MKKVVGVILTILGYACSHIGVALFVEFGVRRSYFENRLLENTKDIFETNPHFNEEQLFISLGLIFLGLLAFIIGIILSVSKTRKQREIEAEYKILTKNAGAN